MLVADIYNTDIYPIQETMTIRDALKFLMTKHFNGVIVVSEREKLVGVLSLQDIAAAVVPSDFQENTSLAEALYQPNFFKEECEKIKDKKVRDIMRKDFITANIQTSIMTVAADFLKNDLYIIPVIEDDKVVGIVTRSEVKKALAKAMDIRATE